MADNQYDSVGSPGASSGSGSPSAAARAAARAGIIGVSETPEAAGASVAEDSELATLEALAEQAKATKTRYIAVTGGVLSGVGKGVISSSIGVILGSHGFHTTNIKIDPYLNIDAGTMSPVEHGEVYVLDDGGEADLDLGNYERFSGLTLTREHNITTGKIYQRVIERERRGDFLGKTVQVIPHVTNEIQDWIERVAAVPTDGSDEVPDFCIIELGGTVGDIESMPFVEALRQFQFRVGRERFFCAHVALVPTTGTQGEQKSKPTQHSLKEMRGLGLSPDAIICRSAEPLEDSVRSKLSMFGHVPYDNVLGVHNLSNLYHVPSLLEAQNFTELVKAKFNMEFDVPDYSPPRSPTDGGASVDTSQATGKPSVLKQWARMARRIDQLTEVVTIALVGKYTGSHDCYHSLNKALDHAAYKADRVLKVENIESSYLEAEMKDEDPALYHDAWRRLCTADGIIVPGGFGERGFEGKVLAANWARTKDVPFLGICLGFQAAAVEFARSVVGHADAHHEEMAPDAACKVVIYMPEVSKTVMGGTMRLGARETVISDPESVIGRLYSGRTSVWERHRHRYEINPALVDELEAGGMKFIGRDTKGERMQISIIPDHPYFVGAQFHPEYNTRPLVPSPPYLGLLLAASNQLDRIDEIIASFGEA